MPSRSEFTVCNRRHRLKYFPAYRELETLYTAGLLQCLKLGDPRMIIENSVALIKANTNAQPVYNIGASACVKMFDALE